MLLEAAQVAADAAKNGTIVLSIPTAFASSAATLLLYKGVPFLFRAISGKPKHNGNGGPRPGEAEICRIRGERMATAEAKIGGIEDTLKRHDGYFQEILRRLPK